MVTVAAAVFDPGAVCGTVLVTAFAAMVRITVPGEQPVSEIVYVVPEPEGAPIVQEDEPVPETEKSPIARPVTASLKIRS